jgi:hypothetical protein
MRPFPRASTPWVVAAVLSLTGSAFVLAAAPASADPTDPTVVAVDPGNTTVVTRLSITDGRGWLTLHAHSSSATGLEVRVPAGNGSWSGSPDVYMPEQDAHCSRQTGPDLHYLCLPSSGEPRLPSGAFSVSIPVTRIGSVEGLTGSAWASAGASGGYVDTFPVLPGSHYRSTAEVRTAPVTTDADGIEERATVSTTMTILPNEAITAVDITPPTVTGDYRFISSNVAGHGVRCTPRWNGSPVVHCWPSDASARGLPAGRYNLVLTIGFRGAQDHQNSQVSLTAAGQSSEWVDTFPYAPAM